MQNILFFSGLVFLMMSCASEKKGADQDNIEYAKGTFGYDIAFLKRYYDDLILLKGEDSNAMAAVVPALQGRVMTTTSNGMSGTSFGWINYELIESGKIKEHIHAVGGEERFWMGPEGGQFTFFFKPGVPFTVDNWYVPKEIDTEPFDMVASDKQQAMFEKSMNLTNYSGNVFDIQVKRGVKLIDKASMAVHLGMSIPEGISCIGIESNNQLINTGSNAWDKEYGMPSVWILSMLNPSDETVVLLPFKEGPDEELGPVVNDVYFGKIGTDRLKVGDGVVYFKADGKSRGKIGIPPKRALPVAGSFDAKSNVLTIAQFSLPAEATGYVNSLWEIQDQPFAGDAVNAYNDGPFEDGSMLGPFYEIESSSPAANLKPGESVTHIHRTYHFSGDPDRLNQVAKAKLGVDLKEVTGVF